MEQRPQGQDAAEDREPEADPIDHDRDPGVPPDANEDVEDDDKSGADSFPASDPPANY